jgi:hypothetical protein
MASNAARQNCDRVAFDLRLTAAGLLLLLLLPDTPGPVGAAA